MPKLLILIGVAFIIAGLVWLLAERFGLGRLPGDIVVERENFRLYIPIATSIIVSIILTLIIWLMNR